LSGAVNRLSFLAWPVVLVSALLLVGLSANSAISLIAEGVHSALGQPSQISTYRAREMAMKPPVLIAATPKLSTAQGSKPPASMDTHSSVPLRAIAMTNLILRSKALTTSASLGGVSKGETLVITSKQGRWWLVSTSDGRQGWLFSAYLSLSRGVP